MINTGLKSFANLMAMKNITSNIDVLCIERQHNVKRELVLDFVEQLLWQKVPAVLHGAQIFFREYSIQQDKTKQDGYVLITGGSRGMGKETAELFAKQGKKLIITGRPGNKQLAQFGIFLQKKYKVKVLPLYLDLKDEKSCLQFVEELQTKSIYVQTVVFNAGVGTKTSLQQTQSNKSQGDILLQVNSLGPIRLYDNLKAKNLINSQTQMLIISSVGSLRGFKQFLQMDIISKVLLQAWGNQLRKTYNVIMVYPGATDTDMFQKSTLNPMKQLNKLEQFVSKLPKSHVIRPEQIGYINNLVCKSQYRQYLRGNKIAACCGMHIDFKPL